MDSALKVFRHDDLFAREFAVYGRLTKFGVTEVAGHAVPSFISLDRELLALEMTLVRPPFSRFRERLSRWKWARVSNGCTGRLARPEA